MGRLAQTLGLTAMKLQTLMAAEDKMHLEPEQKYQPMNTLESAEFLNARSCGNRNEMVSNNDLKFTGLMSRVATSNQSNISALAEHSTLANQFLVEASRRCAAPRSPSNDAVRVGPRQNDSLRGPRRERTRYTDSDMKRYSVYCMHAIRRSKSLL